MKKTVLFTLLILVSMATGPAFAERLAVSASVANIRSGPGTRHEVMWQVEKYYPLAIIEKRGNWYHFKDFEDDRGWIHRSLVKNIPSVITARPKCNVRSGPGPGHDIVFMVEKGIPFKVLERKGKWIHVEHADGDTGWIFRTLVW